MNLNYPCPFPDRLLRGVLIKSFIRYLEVRFAPQLHIDASKPDMKDVVDILTHVNRGLQKARDEINASEDIVAGPT